MVFTYNNVTYQTGWRNDPAEVQRVLASLPMPYFATSASHLNGSGEGKTVLLSSIYKKWAGQHMPAQFQSRGTCVSRAWSRCVDYLQVVQISLGHLPQEFKFVSHAYIYGCAREIGNDLSYQDGAVGAWAAQAVNTLGVITNEEAGDNDNDRNTNDILAVKWGSQGVPQKYKDLGKNRLVKTVSLVKTAAEARDAICNGYPVSCCSNQGFTMHRDSEGHCSPQGSWSHDMMWSGYDADKNRFLVEQSWGQNTPDGPLYLDQPDNSFWIDWDVADHMLQMQDSFSLSNFVGFPSQNLNWFI